MTAQPPVACSLSETDLPERLAAARALGADALVGLEVGEASARLRFAGERDRIEELVAAERHCCGFLEYAVDESADAIELVIRAPEGGEPTMRSLVAAIVAGWEGGI